MLAAESRPARPHYMTKITNGIAASMQDLSKGFVPIILVFAMIGSAVFIANKIERLAVQQETTTATLDEVKKDVSGLPELGKDVALLSAAMQTQSQLNVTVERDIKLLETQLKNMEIALGQAGIHVK